MGEFIAGAGGKRLRPILLLIAARLAGYQGPRAVRMGCVVELLHTATLIHDDVVDQAPLRRGRPSANARWGDDASILVGDHLYSKSFALMVGDGDPRVLDTLARATVSMTEAEVFQLERKRSGTTSEADYLRIITQKTASFMSACCRIGGMLGRGRARAGGRAHALRARHRHRVPDQRRFARLRRRPGAPRQGGGRGPQGRQAHAAPHRHPRARGAGRARAHPVPAQAATPSIPRRSRRSAGSWSSTTGVEYALERAHAYAQTRQGGARALPRLRGQGDAACSSPTSSSIATAEQAARPWRARSREQRARTAARGGFGPSGGATRSRRTSRARSASACSSPLPPRRPSPGGGRAGRGAPVARAGLRFRRGRRACLRTRC